MRDQLVEKYQHYFNESVKLQQLVNEQQAYIEELENLLMQLDEGKVKDVMTKIRKKLGKAVNSPLGPAAAVALGTGLGVGSIASSDSHIKSQEQPSAIRTTAETLGTLGGLGLSGLGALSLMTGDKAARRPGSDVRRALGKK